MTAETAAQQNISASTPGPATESITPEATFDISKDALSFAALESGRSAVYRSSDTKERFRTQIESMPTTGELGRRRGLGLWIIAEYQRCIDELAAYETDDTAAYTRARSMLSLGRYEEALAIFQRLSDKHPQEPRRAGPARDEARGRARKDDDAPAGEDSSAPCRRARRLRRVGRGPVPAGVRPSCATTRSARSGLRAARAIDRHTAC
jgi:tetratricopeptide (TPR) repeat protein